MLLPTEHPSGNRQLGDTLCQFGKSFFFKPFFLYVDQNSSFDIPCCKLFFATDIHNLDGRIGDKLSECLGRDCLKSFGFVVPKRREK